MAQFKAFASNVEVNGETVLSVVDGMGIFKDAAFKVLEENGIKNPTPGKWYPQQSWLNAFKKISETIGQTTLLQIGKKIPESAKFPPEINTIEIALSAIDVAYHMNHRNGEIGHYHYEKLEGNSAKVKCENPYPCNFDKGIVYAMANKFKPTGSGIAVEHDNNAPCRNKGGESCTFIVKWQ